MAELALTRAENESSKKDVRKYYELDEEEEYRPIQSNIKKASTGETNVHSSSDGLPKDYPNYTGKYIVKKKEY